MSEEQNHDDFKLLAFGLLLVSGVKPDIRVFFAIGLANRRKWLDDKDNDVSTSSRGVTMQRPK